MLLVEFCLFIWDSASAIKSCFIIQSQTRIRISLQKLLTGYARWGIWGSVVQKNNVCQLWLKVFMLWTQNHGLFLQSLTRTDRRTRKETDNFGQQVTCIEACTINHDWSNIPWISMPCDHSLHPYGLNISNDWLSSVCAGSLFFSQLPPPLYNYKGYWLVEKCIDTNGCSNEYKIVYIFVSFS